MGCWTLRLLRMVLMGNKCHPLHSTQFNRKWPMKFRFAQFYQSRKFHQTLADNKSRTLDRKFTLHKDLKFHRKMRRDLKIEYGSFNAKELWNEEKRQSMEHKEMLEIIDDLSMLRRQLASDFKGQGVTQQSRAILNYPYNHHKMMRNHWIMIRP